MLTLLYQICFTIRVAGNFSVEDEDMSNDDDDQDDRYIFFACKEVFVYVDS